MPQAWWLRQHIKTIQNIMNSLKSICATTVAATTALLLTACGGGGGTINETSAGFTIDSGLAQKGPLVRGSTVTINSLNTLKLQPTGSSYNFEIINDYGLFNPSGITFSTSILETTALGYYFNEVTGKVSKDIAILRALSSLTTDRAVNVNVLTDIANLRTRKLATTGSKPLTFTAARAQAQSEVLAAFYIYNSADLMPGGADAASFSELDLAKSRIADQILATLSAQITQIGQDGSGISTFLNQFEADIADDGLINNSPGFTLGVRAQLDAAAAAINFSQVAGNLNNFYKSNAYKAPDLSQWIDSSGGVDRLIDKYKFTTDAASGAEKLSPAYAAGIDDAGKCISVDSGRLYKNGLLVVSPSKAIKGDIFKIGLTGAIGESTAYLMRAPLDSGGACSPAPSPGNLVRIAKFSVVQSISGTAFGLASGKSVVLTNNNDPLTVTANGVFVFSKRLPAGSTISVSVTSQPVDQVCTVQNGDGIVGLSNITNISVQCINLVIVSTFAGNFGAGSADGQGSLASFNTPFAVAVDLGGTLYVADHANHKIRKISSLGVVSTLAGSGLPGDADGIGSNASFNYPLGVAVDAGGNVYVADSSNRKIRKITPTGLVSTLAGNRNATFPIDGMGTAAGFGYPVGVAATADGIVYVADAQGNSIRQVSPDGVVTTIAGSGAVGSTDGNGLSASFNYPFGVALDRAGNIFVADSGNSLIRKVSTLGQVTTFAGTGTGGSTDGPGMTASFAGPYAVAVDQYGNIFVADSQNNKIRAISSDGLVSTLAGNGNRAFANGLAASASFIEPSGIAVDLSGTIYVAEMRTNLIRKITR